MAYCQRQAANLATFGCDAKRLGDFCKRTSHLGVLGARALLLASPQRGEVGGGKPRHALRASVPLPAPPPPTSPPPAGGKYSLGTSFLEIALGARRLDRPFVPDAVLA